MFRFPKSIILAVIAIAPVACSAGTSAPGADQAAPVLTGKAAFTDAAHESPGTRRHLTAADLPAPSQESVDNGPSLVPRPANAWPKAPRDSRSTSMPPASRIPASSAPPPTATSFLAESKAGKIRRVPRSRRRRQASTDFSLRGRAAISRSASRSIPWARSQVRLHRRHRLRLCAFPTKAAT